jgi:multiple sugar transport system substrate-binding protein
LPKKSLAGQKNLHIQVDLTAHCAGIPSTLLLLFLSVLVFLNACSPPPLPLATPTTAAPVLSPTATGTALAPTSSPTATITPLPTSSLEVNRSDLNGTEITFWHPWPSEIIPNLVAEFNASNEFGIVVESIYQGNINSLYEQIADPELVTSLPNLTIGSSDQVSSWIAQGKPVVDLSAYLEDPQWGLSPEERADFFQIFLEQDVSTQSQIGFPASRSSQLIFYNASWGEELGFTSPPDTPQEFMEQACAASRANSTNDESEDDGTGGWLINTTPSAVLSWIYAFGNPVVLADGSGYQFDTSQTEQAFVFLKELFDQGCAWEVLESPHETQFAARRAIFTTGSLTDLEYQSQELRQADNKDKWTVIGFPSPDGEPVISVYGPSFLIFAGSEEENLAAWLLIEWLTSPEQQAKFVTAHGSFPTRESTMGLLGDYAVDNPQWAAAQELLASAQPEPNLESWNVVRWVLSDVGTQLFRYYFTPERIPATLELMDETASELHQRTQ